MNRTTAHALVVAVLAVGFVVPASAQSVEPPVIPGVTRVLPAAPDFASETFGDPWDYANPEDILTDTAPGAPMSGANSVRLQDGHLRFDAAAGAWFSPVWINYTTALPTNRDGPQFPVDAGRYTHLSIHLYASQETSAAIMWFRCREWVDACLGGHRFTARSGWNTYELQLRNEFPGLPQPWEGQILGMRVVLAAGSPTTFEVDWLRLFRPQNDPVPLLGPGPFFWDSDAEPGNNTPGRPGWGHLPTGTFNADAFPPGTYRFYMDHGAGPGPYSEALVVDDPPLPVIDQPDMAGGEDYQTVTTGDPWDFSQHSDGSVHNVTDVVWSDGQLHATNGPPNYNDSHIVLRLAPSGLDPDRYHRLTFRMTYDGPFDLGDSVGGGTHGRVIWQRADTGDAFHDGRALVTFTDRHTYTAVLATDPPQAVQEPENAVVRGWTGSPITLLRFDPNEDRGPRRWHVDDVRLRADDESRDGAFTIEWHDPAHQAGTRVTLFADHDDRGFDGRPVAEDLVQEAGPNAFTWNVRDELPGRRWIHLTADDGTSRSRTYATGPVTISPRLAGPDRIDTALSLARSAFPDGAPVAVVAAAGDFPDALAAAPLASAAGGPILLNVHDRLDPRVRAELERLGADTIYLMGGPAAQTGQVERDLERIAGVTVRRLAGADRFGTAAAAAREAVNRWRQAGHEEAGRHVLVALGTSYPDALAAGPLAAASRRPLLLVTPDAVPPATRSALADLRVRGATVIGGTAAIDDPTAHQLGVATDRLGGASRYDTAAIVAGAAGSAGADTNRILLATGEGFPDALAAGPAIAARRGVLLLTGRATVPPETDGFLRARAGRLGWLRVAGGPAAVHDPTVRTLLTLAGLR